MPNTSTSVSSGYLFAASAVVIWTGFILVSRIGGVSPLLPEDIIAIRYATSAVILLPIWWFKFRFKLLNTRLLCCSLAGGIGYASCAFKGFELAPASHAAVILPGLMPLFITLLSSLLLRNSVSRSHWYGVTVITIGALVLFKSDNAFGEGQLWLVCAAFFWALFSVLVKHWGISAWEVTISLALITCALYTPLYLIALPSNIDPTLWVDILIQAFYQGILATIVQMLFYIRAIHIIGPVSMGAMMAAVPILASILSVLILNEPSGAPLILSTLLVSLGIGITSGYLTKASSTDKAAHATISIRNNSKKNQAT